MKTTRCLRLFFCLAGLAAAAIGAGEPDYSREENWAWFGEGEGKPADLFIVCPTVDMRDETNMSLDDEQTKAAFAGALAMERGIYEDTARLYAPYYRQASMKAYSLPEAEREAALAFAYRDVSAAFARYLSTENNGRPVILAGFSQGADMCQRLLADFFADDSRRALLVAAYAIGWPLTPDLVRRHPQIRPAQGAADTGVVVAFDCEAPGLGGTFINPAGQQAFGINPLNWRTDATPADRSENLGACFTDYSGAIRREIPALCGARLDPERGVVEVPDLAPADYPPIVPGLPPGAYHVYDYLFFFRNLQENVRVRTASHLAGTAPPSEPGYFDDGGEAKGLAVAAKRGIGLDIGDVRSAQDSELAHQARDRDHEAWFSPDRGAVGRTVDAFHDTTFRLLDNLVRTLDLSWTMPGVDYDVELSSFSLEPMYRVGGRGKDKDSEFKLKLRVDTALPGLAKRFHLVFDNAGRDYLPGSDPMRREDDWRVGVKSAWDTWSGGKFDAGGGLRLRGTKPVGFAEADLKWEWDLAEGCLGLTPRVTYHTDTRWGHDIRLAWRRWFGHRGRWGVELSAAESHNERLTAFEFEQTLKIARARGTGHNHGWLFQASLFPHLPERHGNLFVDDALLALSWKSPVYRRWLYATLTPQVDFAEEDRHHPRYSFRIGFEILFGGQTRDLL